MYELEVKAWLRQYPVAEAVRRLEEAGCQLREATVQTDRVAAFSSADVEHPQAKTIVVRTREEGAATTFTLKKHLSAGLNSLELQVTIDDAATMLAIVGHLGLKEIVTVRKARRLGRLGDTVVCLDDVDGLGCFVEFELLSVEPLTDEHLRGLRAAMRDVFGSKVEIVEKGYDALLIEARRTASPNSSASASVETGRGGTDE